MSNTLQNRTLDWHPVNRQVVHLFADLVHAFGLPASIGEIFGFIFSNPEPVPFETVVSELQISRGSASQGLRFLQKINAIQVTQPNNGRRSLYSPQTSLRHLISGVLAESLQPRLTQSAQRIEQLQSLADEHGDLDPVLLDRLELLNMWSRRTHEIMPFINRFSQPKPNS